MKIGTRTRYGLRTVLEIARSDNDGGVFQKDIAISQALSNKYLDHIIHALKIAGLITNVKGKKSGYKLARKTEEITLFDVHQAFEPNVCLVECLSHNYTCDREAHCVARGIWKELNLMIVNYMKSVSLSDLIARNISLEKNLQSPIYEK